MISGLFDLKKKQNKLSSGTDQTIGFLIVRIPRSMVKE
jgi:hypothetical protein